MDTGNELQFRKQAWIVRKCILDTDCKVVSQLTTPGHFSCMFTQAPQRKVTRFDTHSIIRDQGLSDALTDALTLRLHRALAWDPVATQKYVISVLPMTKQT